MKKYVGEVGRGILQVVRVKNFYNVKSTDLFGHETGKLYDVLHYVVSNSPS